MYISLTPQLDAYVNEKVQSGQYHSASEVIGEALRLLAQQEEKEQTQMNALREEVRKGLSAGEAHDWNPDQFKLEARLKFGITE